MSGMRLYKAQVRSVKAETGRLGNSFSIGEDEFYRIRPERIERRGHRVERAVDQQSLRVGIPFTG
jgi:hypothetical protein